MNDSLETFLSLTFRRRGARRVVTDDRGVHDVTLLVQSPPGTKPVLSTP